MKGECVICKLSTEDRFSGKLLMCKILSRWVCIGCKNKVDEEFFKFKDKFIPNG